MFGVPCMLLVYLHACTLHQHSTTSGKLLVYVTLPSSYDEAVTMHKHVVSHVFLLVLL